MINKLLIILSTGFVFTSAFGQISTLPFVEDFESQPTGPTGCGPTYSFTGVTWMNGDDAVPAIATHQVDWTVDVGGTGSGNTGPSVDHTLGTAAGKYIYAETSCSGTGFPTREFDLVSPWLNLTAYPNVQLAFWYHAYGTTMGNLDVQVRVGSLSPWTTIIGPITDNVDLWQESSICLPGGIDSVQVRFTYISGTSFGGDIGLDDISISPVTPVDVGVTDIVGIGGCGLSSSETVEVTICNFGDSIAPGTIIPVNYSFNGGAPVAESFTVGAAGLAGVCDGGGCSNYSFTTTVDVSVSGTYTLDAWTSFATDLITSNDSTSISINSLPIVSFPYFEDFESGPSGWTVDNSSNGTWAFGTPAKPVIQGAASGDSCFVNGGLAGTYSANAQSSVTSPCIDISTANGSEVVTMKIWWESENSWDGANLFSSVDGGSNWSQIGSFGDPNNWYTDNTINGNPQGSQEGWTGSTATGSNGWVCATHDLDSTTMVDNSSIMFRVGFGSDGSVQYEGFAFDDFALGYPLSYSIVPDSIFACDTVAIVDAGSGYDWYSWSDNPSGTYGTIGNQDSTFMSAANGVHYVTVSDSVGMCATDAFQVNVLDFIPPAIDDILLCVGDSAVFDAGGDITGNALYNWSTGDTTQTSWLFTDGMITIIKSDSVTGCMVSDSASLTYLSVTLSDVTLCDGDSTMLDGTTPSSNATYLWNSGETSAMITVGAAGVYGVSVMDTVLGCTVTDSMTLTINPLPTPTITGQQDTLCTYNTIDIDAGAGFTSYSWSTGGNGQVETIDGSTLSLGVNVFTVTVVDANGCSNTDSVTMVVDGCATIDELEGLSMSIYPNPSQGVFNYEMSEMNDEVNIIVTDLSGKIVLDRILNSTVGTIDLSRFEDGVYILNIEHNDASTSVRLVKQ